MKKINITLILLTLILSCEEEPTWYHKFTTKQTFEDHIEVEVEWKNDDAVLSGTLYLPVMSGKFPTLVFVDGSGKTERIKYYSSKELVKLVLAKEYTDRGYAIFSYDKRGVGLSGGEYNPINEYSNYYQLGRDALSALQIIKNHPSIDPSHVGFIGGSQAGYVIPIVAKSSNEIAFNIIINGPTGPNGEEYLFSTMTLDDPVELQLTRDCSRINLDSIYTILELNRQRGYNYWGYNPYEDLTLMNQPCMFLQGLRDFSQPARLSVNDLLKIKKDFNKNWQIISYEDGDHFLLTGNARCVYLSGGILEQNLHFQVDWQTPVFEWLNSINK